ncbi:MAG: GntR family transcriptional regulator [Pacificimonas sp.]
MNMSGVGGKQIVYNNSGEGIAMTAAERAYAKIQAAIISGTLAPGSGLTESALAEIALVSRTPVRAAVQRLESEGLVARSPTGRLSVTDWQQTDLDDLFTLRAMLEGHAAERAAGRIDEADLAALRIQNDEIEAAIGAPGGEPDVPRFLAANRRLHDIIIAAAASERTATMLSQLVEQPLVRATARRYDRDLFVRSHEEHGELIAALARGDGVWARAVMTGHIRRAYHALVAVRSED